jgi:class 3 adenylate cyclase
VGPEEFEALGLYDPQHEHAALRLELLNLLVERGATVDDLLGWHDRLPGLAAVLALRTGPPMTVGEVAAAAGLTTDDVRRVMRVAGFVDPDPQARLFGPEIAQLAAGLSAVSGLFGEEALYQMLRVLGSAMARVADAVVSAFLVNVEPAARREDPVGLGVARANLAAAELLPMVTAALDVLFRQHLVAAQRTVLDEEDLIGYETRRLVVGFVDLVGSTELGERLSVADLGAVLTAFEHLAADTVTAHGGRVVKLIGDEILFTASEPAPACTIAIELATAAREDPRLPAVRAGLASGPVMFREGDVFGPVVNLAARVVKAAEPGEVLATAPVTDAAGVASSSLGLVTLKGIGDVELRRVHPS